MRKPGHKPLGHGREPENEAVVKAGGCGTPGGWLAVFHLKADAGQFGGARGQGGNRCKHARADEPAEISVAFNTVKSRGSAEINRDDGSRVREEPRGRICADQSVRAYLVGPGQVFR